MHRAIPEINQFTSGGIITAPMSQAYSARGDLSRIVGRLEKKKNIDNYARAAFARVCDASD